MAYPVSDHFDGEHFFNPEPANRVPAPPGGRQFGVASFLWNRFVRGRMPEGWSTWPDEVANVAYPAPGLPAEGEIAVTFIGHASFLLRVGGLTILTDPVFARRASPTQAAGPKRVRAPGIALQALPPIDLVLLSHNHYDHLDLAALKALRRRFVGLPIVTGLGNAAYFARRGLAGVVELDWWQTHTLGAARITATPARHFAARTLWDRNKTLWCGFILAVAGKAIYFAGDTGYTRYFRQIRERLGAPDLALLPIGAYAPAWIMSSVHMNPAEAVRGMRDVGAKQAVGMHFGTFQLTAEPIDEPPRELARQLDAAGVPQERFVTLDVGETRLFNGEQAGAGSGNRTRASSLGS